VADAISISKGKEWKSKTAAIAHLKSMFARYSDEQVVGCSSVWARIVMTVDEIIDEVLVPRTHNRR
jgi:hypothetical protein